MQRPTFEAPRPLDHLRRASAGVTG